ncbi:TPM domain-containing protein [Paludibacteraceae bacterium OttesenSCG-928-F17]|nr:TPM domain-containing protein [Paludibacteraceae bacterium OttesenSCG-928-F17]
MKKHFLLCFLLFISHSVFSAEYTVENLPNPKTYDATDFVSNPDRILSSQTVSQLNQIINSLENDTKAEIAVVAVNSIGVDDVKSFAVRLFEKWGVGKAKADNGLLILFVLDQRTIVFETGYGLEGVLPDAIASRIINQTILPEFRKGNYDAGIIAGVQRASSVIREEPVFVPEKEGINWGVASPVAVAVYILLMLLSFLWMSGAVKNIKTNPRYPHNAARYYAVKKQRASITSTMAFVLPLIAFLVIIFFFNPAYLLFLIPVPFMVIPANIYGRVQMNKVRTQPIPCEACDGMMRIVSEKEEDKYLNDAQKFEEKIGSVDYDVYVCDKCEEVKILRIDKTSAYSVCPNCGTKAFIQDRKQITKEPTYSSTGIERVTYKCKYCGFEQHTDRKLPRLDRSAGAFVGGMAAGSSMGRGGGFGGGGSFGGGRSGGGGASGRW